MDCTVIYTIPFQNSKIKLFFLHLFVCVVVGLVVMAMHAKTCMWRPGENVWALVVFFHNVDLGTGT